MPTRALELARECYLSEQKRTDAKKPAQVRAMVVASWQRSIEHAVDMRRLNVPFEQVPDPDTALVRAAMPIMDTLHGVLANEPVSIMLTDKDGLVLARKVSHAGLTSRLNRVQLAPGHVFSERYAGTNGIGTTLASGAAAVISGSEHYVEDLRSLHCAAVPILHPTRRVLLGAFNLTTPVSHSSGGMALALTQSTAQQIERELARISSQREYNLFERYMQACRSVRQVPVLALNDDVVMMNDKLRSTIAGPDQEALLSHAREFADDPRFPGMRSTTLPSGRVVELRATTSDPDDDAGAVFQVRLVGRQRDKTTRSVRATPPPPGVVGSSPTWVKAVAEVQAAYAARVWTAVLGEAGTGKTHLVGAVHRAVTGRAPTLLDPPVSETVPAEDAWLGAVAEALRDPHAVVVLRGTHLLSPRLALLLTDALTAADRDACARLFVTIQQPTLGPDTLQALCGAVVQLPPVRHRSDDVTALVQHFLRRYRPAGDLACSPGALHLLHRCPWPENIRQVETVVRTLARQQSLRLIEPDDLPPECRVTSRAPLTPMESAERDAILRGLLEHDANVFQAAKNLGISRATIYRKMRRYGIDPTTLT